MLSHGTLLQNRYRVIRRIGQGGMGAVYEARHEELGHTFALKEAFHTDDESLRRAFKREARTLAGLQHLGLPRVIDYFAEGDGLYLVMEYVDGDNLLKLLVARGEPFPAEEVMGWTEQLLDVLEYLHTRPTPVIHRDIKPSNVKLNLCGNVVLLDFGLSKGVTTDASSIVASRSVLGFTLTYAPLEQILKADPNLAQHLTVVDADRVEGILQKPTDAASDIYSLAASLYHLLTNRQPTQAPTRAVAVWSGKPDPLRPADEVNPSVPAGLSVLLQRALRLDSAERVGSAAEMREGLAEVRGCLAQPTELASVPPTPHDDSTQEEEETVTPPPVPQPPVPQPALQRLVAFVPVRLRAYALPAAGVLLIVLFFSAASLLRPRYDPPPVAVPSVNGAVASPSPSPPLPPPEHLADDDLIPYRRGNKWGFSLANRRLIVVPKYDGVEPFAGGMARVWYEEKSGGFESKGKQSKPAKVKKSFGFVNKDGKEVIEVKYRSADPFKNDMTRVVSFSDGLPLCFRKNDDKVEPVGCPTPTPAPATTASHPAPAPTRAPPIVYTSTTNDAGRCAFLDGNFRPLTGYVYDDCGSASENMIKVRVGEAWGFVDLNGRVKIRPSFQDVKSFSGELAAAKLNDRWGFINKSGDWMIQNKYAETCSFSEGWACVKDPSTGKFGYINREGAVRIAFEYDDAKPFNNRVAKVKKDGGYNYINTEKKQLFPTSYDDMEYPFDADWAKVKSGGKWGIIDRTGEEVVKPKYDKINSGQFLKKLWRVDNNDGIWFYIGRDGIEYYEPEETPAKQQPPA